MKKKFIKIIFINILLLFAFVFFIELFLYNSIVRVYHRYSLQNYSIEDCVDTAQNYDRNFFHEEYTKKAPIWVMGCSYAWGHMLNVQETFSEKLSNYTKRAVYNWSWCGIGPAEALIRLYTNKNDKYLPKKTPEYVIYIYMYNHISRYPCNYNILYALKEFNVIEGKNKIYDKLYIVKAIKQGLFNKKMDLGENSIELKKQFMTKMFFAMKKEVEKKYPKTKFVILLYNDSNKDFHDNHHLMANYEYEVLNSKDYWQKYKNNGFIVISTKDLIGREMDLLTDRIKNDKADTPHPTAEVWDIIIPKLSKELSL